MGGRLGPELGHVFFNEGRVLLYLWPLGGNELDIFNKEQESCCSWNRMKEGVNRLENWKI